MATTDRTAFSLAITLEKESAHWRLSWFIIQRELDRTKHTGTVLKVQTIGPLLKTQQNILVIDYRVSAVRPGHKVLSSHTFSGAAIVGSTLS